MAASHGDLLPPRQAADGRAQPRTEFGGELHPRLPRQSVFIELEELLMAAVQVFPLAAVGLDFLVRPDPDIRADGGIFPTTLPAPSTTPSNREAPPPDRGAMADQRARHGGAIARIGARQQDRAPDFRVVAHVAAVVQHGERPDLSPAPIRTSAPI